MARIRTVKPELFKHEDLYDLEETSGLPIRVAFIGLFTCCDREGRFKWRPRTLKLDVLPHDNVDFSRVLDALGTRGFIRKYEVEGEEYGVIPTFSKHQVINNRESDSDIPAPAESSYISIASTREARVDDATATRTQGKGKEGKGREEEGKGKDLMSGKPDDAAEILDFLNAHAKRSYKPVKANLEKIEARLKEGSSMDEIKDVIRKKCQEWAGTKMEQYLRPDTLFNATKFNQYVGQLGLPISRFEERGSNSKQEEWDRTEAEFLAMVGGSRSESDPYTIDMEDVR